MKSMNRNHRFFRCVKFIPISTNVRNKNVIIMLRLMNFRNTGNFHRKQMCMQSGATHLVFFFHEWSGEITTISCTKLLWLFQSKTHLTDLGAIFPIALNPTWFVVSLPTIFAHFQRRGLMRLSTCLIISLWK